MSFYSHAGNEHYNEHYNEPYAEHYDDHYQQHPEKNTTGNITISSARQEHQKTHPTPADDLPLLRINARLRYVIISVFTISFMCWIFLAPLGYQHLGHSPVNMGSIPLQAPQSGHIFGTDIYGKDVWIQLSSGGWSLAVISFVITTIIIALSIPVSIAAAIHPFIGGIINWVISFVMIIPAIFIILIMSLLVPHHGVITLIAIASILGIPFTVQIIYCTATAIVHTGYVNMAVNNGEPLWYLIFYEILPNIKYTIITQIGLRYAESLYLVSTSAFLQNSDFFANTNWATMVKVNAGGIMLNPWACILPALAIATLATVVNGWIASWTSLRSNPYSQASTSQETRATHQHLSLLSYTNDWFHRIISPTNPTNPTNHTNPTNPTHSHTYSHQSGNL